MESYGNVDLQHTFLQFECDNSKQLCLTAVQGKQGSRSILCYVCSVTALTISITQYSMQILRNGTEQMHYHSEKVKLCPVTNHQPTVLIKYLNLQMESKSPRKCMGLEMIRQ